MIWSLALLRACSHDTWCAAALLLQLSDVFRPCSRVSCLLGTEACAEVCYII